MQLITWNVNSIRARLPRLVELLAAHSPDVVCVQETKSTAETFPHAAIADAGYRAIDHSTGRWNGVALLVPQDVEVVDVHTGLPGEPDPAEGRWIEGTVLVAGEPQRRGVRVVSTYVPNGRELAHPMFAAKLAFLERMRARAHDLTGAGPTVVAGDLNIAPADRDVWDVAAFVGATHVTEEERSRLEAVTAAGFVDAFRAVEPDAEGFTWWDYRMGAFRRGMGMRIDLALVSTDLTVRTCAVDTSFRRVNDAGDKPSDHAPLIVDIEV